jgi:hypothetical protein
VVLLDDMMEGSAGANAHLLIENLAALLELLHGPVPSCIGIQRNRERISVPLPRVAEEPLRGSHIPSLTEKGVHALAVLIHSPVQVRPATASLYVPLSTRQLRATGFSYPCQPFSNSGA